MVTPRVKEYLKLNSRYLKEAEELLSKGDFVQASEKFWGAVVEMVKVVAEAKGWEHDRHRDLAVSIAKLYKETGDPDIPRLFASAERLHSNFYENFAPEDLVRLYAGDAERLIEKLKGLKA